MKDFECHSFVIIIFIHNLSYHYGLQRGTITRTKTKRRKKKQQQTWKESCSNRVINHYRRNFEAFSFFSFSFFLLVLLKFILLFA